MCSNPFKLFDELDYRTSMQMNYWLSGSWEPSYRYLYSNDATGRIVESTFQFWMDLYLKMTI